MDKPITKSLFVEFMTQPKLARWHVHDKKWVYKDIMTDKYGTMDGKLIWDTVEDLILQTYDDKTHIKVDDQNLFPNFFATFVSRTQTVVQQSPEVISQWAFMVHNVFVKSDFLVQNPQWTYDLVEVKAKNSIRKKTKNEPLLDQLIADISIQHRVLTRTLGEKFSGRCYIAHLDKEFRKDGPVDPKMITITEDVTGELMEPAQIDIVLQAMRESLVLDQERFNSRYPYDGASDYLSYFGTHAPKQWLRSITNLSASKRLELYEQEKLKIADLDDHDIEFLKNAKWEHSKASRCVELRQAWEEVIDSEQITQELTTLTYPLYFYDYETISSPVPLLDHTGPWQQVIAQYSLHKITADGTMTHHEWLLEPWVTSNKSLLQKMIQDMDEANAWTFIVRYKGFENSRNNERALTYPEYAEQLTYINNHTFDLMELFSKQLYFHRDFHGSSSIKKILPVLTDISYDGLQVPNGAVAMDILTKMVAGQYEWMELEAHRADLLQYCKQDTYAMVRIWEEVKEKITR